MRYHFMSLRVKNLLRLSIKPGFYLNYTSDMSHQDQYCLTHYIKTNLVSY